MIENGEIIFCDKCWNLLAVKHNGAPILKLEEFKDCSVVDFSGRVEKMEGIEKHLCFKCDVQNNS